MFGFPFPVVVSACRFVPAYNASNEHDTICIGLTRIAYGMQPSPYITCARGNRCRVHCHRFHSFYIRQNLRPDTLHPRASLPLRSRCLPCVSKTMLCCQCRRKAQRGRRCLENGNPETWVAEKKKKYHQVSGALEWTSVSGTLTLRHLSIFFLFSKKFGVTVICSRCSRDTCSRCSFA